MEGKESGPARSLLTERWMTVAIVVITLLFLSVNWYYYNKTRSALDDEFSIRLRALASLAAASVDPELVDIFSPELAGFGADDPKSQRSIRSPSNTIWPVSRYCARMGSSC